MVFGSCVVFDCIDSLSLPSFLLGSIVEDCSMPLRNVYQNVKQTQKICKDMSLKANVNLFFFLRSDILMHNIVEITERFYSQIVVQ